MATGVDNFEVRLVHIAHRRNAIPRHAGRRFDNTLSPSGKDVEQTALADVRSAHNGNYR